MKEKNLSYSLVVLGTNGDVKVLITDSTESATSAPTKK